MIMQPYKRTKRSIPLSILLVKGALLLGGIVVVFVLIRLLVGKSRPMPLAVDDVRREFASKAALIAKIDELEHALGAQAALVEQSAMLEQENEALKAQFGRSPAKEGTLARVVAAPRRSFYDTLVIDAGSDEGVAVGAIAYAFDSIALGSVASVDAHRAVVELFSAPARETAGTAEGSETTITLIGRGGGEYEVRMPRDMHFTIGELVSYQSIDSAVLAKVEKIVTDPRDPFQRLLAKAPVNLSALKFVIVK